MGDVRFKAVAVLNIAIIRLQQADATSRSEAIELLSQAHRDFARMRLPEAEVVRRIAADHGLELEASEPE